MAKLKSSLQDILGDVKWLSQKFRENQNKIEDIVEENKVIAQKLDESNLKMVVAVEQVSNLSEKAVVDPECSEEWTFYPEVNFNPTQNSSVGQVCTEQIAADTRDRNNRLKITVVTQNEEVPRQASMASMTGNVMDGSNIVVADGDDESKKENEVMRQMSTSKGSNLGKENVVVRQMSKSLERYKEVVTVDNSNNEKEKCETTNFVRKRKFTQMMNQTEPSKQAVEDGSSRRLEEARTKSVLNQSVIDCEFVLKKGVVKEKQVMTPKKIKTEAAHLLDLFECNICTKSFTSAAPLAAHLKNHTKGTDMIDCPFPSCNHSGNQLKLTQHMRSKHTMEKLFSCYSCPAKFATLDAKTAHEKKHSQSSLQQCGRCSRFYNVMKGSCRCCFTQN